MWNSLSTLSGTGHLGLLVKETSSLVAFVINIDILFYFIFIFPQQFILNFFPGLFSLYRLGYNIHSFSLSLTFYHI